MNTLAFALLSLSAHADRAFEAPEACEIAMLTGSMPADGATDLPTDLAPILAFQGNCGVPAPFTVSLFRGEETDPLRTDVYDFDAFSTVGNGGVLELDLGPLDADTTYTLVTDDDFGQSTTIAFETGSGTTAGFDGAAPSVSIDRVTSDRVNGTWEISVDVTVTSASDDPTLSAYILRSGGVERDAFLASGPTDSRSLLLFESDRPDEVCVTAAERDAAGTWHGPSETTCAPVPKTIGCSSTALPASTLGLLGLLALPLLRRRELS